MKWQIPWSNLEKNRTTRLRQIRQNQSTGMLLDGSSRWVRILYSPSNPNIYRKRRNRNAKKQDWNTERRKQQTNTWYVWERYINKTSNWNIKRRNGQTKVANRNQTNAETSILSKYTVRHEKQICLILKHSEWSVR